MATPEFETFGKYQIIGRIATGGMAELYKARLEGIGGFQRIFAIKRILPHLSSNSEYVAMLVDEAKVAGLLSHANIVQILDLGQVEGVWYIAMEFVDGHDLGAILKRARVKALQLPLPHTVFVAIELLKGLEYAHQRQVMRGGRPVPLDIIHRDVSPPNILVSYQGEVKLTDFGIARASHKALETQSGVIKGRFDYMSPEQAAGAKDLDQRSDLFSVGVVLYEMLTGKHPFRSPSEFGTLERVRTGRYEPVSSANQGIPFALETIVDRALRVDRNERYPSATAFKEALDKFFHDAGFLFTHSTLASYLRSLFPEADPRTSPPQASPRVVPAGAPTDPDDIQLEYDVEDPTHMIDEKDLANELDRQGSGDFGLRREAEESTLIRPSPLTNQEAAQWADEQETVIKTSPLTRPVEREREPEPEVSEDDEIAEVAGEAPAPRRGSLVGLIGAAAGLALLLVGLVVGGGAVIGVQLLGGVSLAPSRTPDTVLRVEAPVGSSVSFNGIPVVGERVVPAGEPIEVAVSRNGQVVYQEDVVLETAEVRVIVIAPAGEGP